MEQSGYIVTLVRRWRIVLAAMVVVTAGSLVADAMRPETYTVSASFLVNETMPELAGTPYASALGAEGWRALYAPVKSAHFVDLALQAADLPVDDISLFADKGVSLVVDSGSRVVSVSAKLEGTEDQALDFMVELLGLVEEYDIEFFNHALDARIEAGRVALEQAWERVQVYDLDQGYTEPLAGGTGAYDAASHALVLAEIARASDKQVFVLMQEPHTEQESPAPLRSGAIGVALGLVAGFGAALIMDAMDRARSEG